MKMMYIRDEQPNTSCDLLKKIKDVEVERDNDILVEFDSVKLTNESFNLLTQLPQIIANDEELEEGSFELGIFKITINKIKTYEKDLIINENTMFNTN